MREIIQGASMGRNWSSGFTLIEVLIAFTFFLILVGLFPLLIHSIPTIAVSNNDIRPFEVQVFFNQLSMEVREANELSINGTTLILVKSNGTVITIEKYQDKIRRRVNGTGHDLFLQKVKSVQYEQIPHGVEIEIEGSNGRVFKRKLYQTYLFGGEYD